MPKREVIQSITIGRGIKTVEVNGKKTQVCKERHELKPGQLFDFTEEELAEIERDNPNAVSSKITIDLAASEDAALRLDTKLNSNESSPPAATGDNGGNTGSGDL